MAVIDGATFTILETIDDSSNVIAIYGSSNGRYVYTYTYGLNQIFEISLEGKVARRVVISKAVMEVPFFTETELYLINTSNTRVYSLDDFSLRTSLAHSPFFSQPIVDPLTGNIGASLSQTEFLIADPLSMKTVCIVQTNDYTDSNDIQLVNGHLLSKYGYRLAIP